MYMKLIMALALCLAFCLGCDRSSAPPAPLAAEQIPAALQKSFKGSKAQIKELSDEVIAALQAKDYPKAFLTLQSLSAQSGLKREQQSIAARAMLTVNNLLQSAQTQGDAQAAETLKTYRANK